MLPSVIDFSLSPLKKKHATLSPDGIDKGSCLKTMSKSGSLFAFKIVSMVDKAPDLLIPNSS
jgi:hypothetical protein